MTRRSGQSVLVALFAAALVSAFLASVIATLHVWEARNQVYEQDLQDRANRMSQGSP